MARFLNTLLLSTITFVVIFCWLIYYVQITWLCAVAALTLSMCCSLILYKYSVGNKRQIKRKRKSEIEAFDVYCCLNDCSDVIMQLFDGYGYPLNSIGAQTYLAKSSHVDKKAQDVNIEFQTRKREENTVTKLPFDFVVALHFSTKPLSEEYAANILKKYKKYCYVLFICNSKGTAERICRLSKVQCAFWEKAELYRRLEEKHLLPVLDARQHKKPSVLLSLALQSSRAKYYFLSSLFLALFGSVSFLPLYNFAFSAFLLGVGLYAKFNKKYNFSTENQFQNSLKKL